MCHSGLKTAPNKLRESSSLNNYIMMIEAEILLHNDSFIPNSIDA